MADALVCGCRELLLLSNANKWSFFAGVVRVKEGARQPSVRRGSKARRTHVKQEIAKIAIVLW